MDFVDDQTHRPLDIRIMFQSVNAERHRIVADLADIAERFRDREGVDVFHQIAAVRHGDQHRELVVADLFIKAPEVGFRLDSDLGRDTHDLIDPGIQMIFIGQFQPLACKIRMRDHVMAEPRCDQDILLVRRQRNIEVDQELRHEQTMLIISLLKHSLHVEVCIFSPDDAFEEFFCSPDRDMRIFQLPVFNICIYKTVKFFGPVHS